MTEITKQEDKTIVKPGQNIVAAMVQDFQDELRQILVAGATNITIDMQGVEILDSMGLSSLIATHNSLKKIDSKLEIINGASNIIKLIKEMRLDQHFVITEEN